MPAQDLRTQQSVIQAVGPQRRLMLAALACGCLAGTPRAQGSDPLDLTEKLNALLPAQALLLGEQHDAPEHQRLARQTVVALAAQGRLAALVLEMLPAGIRGTNLLPNSTPQEARQALRWDEGAWPWAAYGPVIMAAIEAGAPVLGGNLPASQMRQAMVRSEFDARLPPAALAQQRQLMRDGHCGLLPESQIAPMARIQIARDLSLAAAVQAALRQAGPQQLVLMLSGSVHADKRLGVPAHLPTELPVRSVRLVAGGQGVDAGQFDAHWPTAPAPSSDHCAALREHFKQRPTGARP